MAEVMDEKDFHIKSLLHYKSDRNVVCKRFPI